MGVGPGGVMGLFNLIVDEGCSSNAAATVTVLIPFAPAAAAMTRLAADSCVEVLGRGESAVGHVIDAIRAERITVLLHWRGA